MIQDAIINDDLEFRDGDLFIAASEQHHIRDIVESGKGEWRQHPLIGVAIDNILNGQESIDLIRKRIEVQLRFDNFDVDEISFTGPDDIQIIARQKE